MDIFETIFNSTTESLIISNNKGIIVNINPATEELFGYSKEELIDQPIDILIPKNVRPHHSSYREKYYQEPSKRKMGAGRDLFGQKKNGSIVPLEISLNHIDSGDNLLVLALITDITKRKNIEERIIELNQDLEQRVNDRTKKLEEAQRLHYLIAQNFPKGTINVFDKDLNYIFVAGEEFLKLGIDSEKLIGRNYIKRLPQDISANVEEKLKQAFDKNSVSFEIKTHNNYYKINAVPIAFENDEVSQILVVEKNITEEKLIEIKVLEALEREKQLNELKSRFVSMASHEFRTPLSTILSSASLIERYVEMDDMEKTTKHISRVKSSVELLTSILNDFLSLSKLEEGKTQINKSSFNIKELFEQILEDFQQSQNNGITLTYTHESQQDIVSDVWFLKNIAHNLLSNAYKYGSSQIICSTRINDKILYISVEDDGIGIPKEEQKNISTRFFRAKNATNIQGTGLGLNIVNHYLELLNGKISFTSEHGKTTFEVSVPVELNDQL